MMRLSQPCIAVALLAAACAAPPLPKTTPAPPAAPPTEPALPGEDHLADLRQLTFGGENAEAYWTWDARALILQARVGDAECDRIYRLPVEAGAALEPISSGKGATTCSYSMPGDREIIYASTHLGGDACPPKPDHGKGYVWALYPSYDIFKSGADGSLSRLTDSPGYDAEGTVCGKDGSIVFTSVRDGDLDLYRMDADGKNVRRLTNGVGYDGGAFFDRDCRRIVWRASRPRPGRELEDYKALLAQNLVRPSKLELFVANADGSEAVQITYLNAASFAPFFHPSGKRVVFSSNVGDPRGREFDLYAVNIDGTALERVTFAPGFDGFPIFSPDGKQLAFSSNRATAPGARDTNVFVARWVESGGKFVPGAADRVMTDIRYLADPAREGRGVGTAGLEAAGAYFEERLRALGLEPAGDPSQFRQGFEVVTAIEVAAGTEVTLDGRKLAATEFVPLGLSPENASVEGELVGAGYGIVEKSLGVDDYARRNVKGKIAVVRRFVPDEPRFSKTDAKRRYGDLRYKAWIARERGAVGLVVVDAPLSAKPAKGAARPTAPIEEARLPALTPEGYGSSGLPALVVKRAAAAELLTRLDRGQRPRGSIALRLAPQKKTAFNVAGLVRQKPADGRVLPGTIVIGAHYDHLGFGGRHSLAPDRQEPHVGADDNASGTAVLLEIARTLNEQKARLRRNVVIVAFSGEETGLLGSAHFVRQIEAGKLAAIPPKQMFGMINLDMVGRLRDNRLQVLGADTASEWRALLEPACNGERVECALSSEGGFGPSDQLSFFVAGVPVLHLFSGNHTDYHKPSDTADKVNAAGAAQVGSVASALALALSEREAPLTYQANAQGPPPRGDMRSFNASLGTIPDYAGPGPGKPGVLLGGVRPGSPAEKAGLRRGDVLLQIGRHDLGSLEDFMFVLNASQPGETARVTVLRDGKPLTLEVTFEARRERMP
jgi:hypothetical protein